MESSAVHTEPQPSTLLDPHWCPGQFHFSGRFDPVVTKATRSGSDPMTTAAGNISLQPLQYDCIGEYIKSRSFRR